MTSVAVAAARSLEAQRSDSLVSDPWAAALVDASGVTTPFPAEWPDAAADLPLWDRSILMGASYIGLRTRFIDDEVLARGIRQVVVLGSGLDTRAWRLEWPADTTVFELDSADVIALVDSVMGATGAVPKCRRVAVAADVTESWAGRIVSRGFDPRRPTMWILEGLLPYLSAHDQAGVLDDVVHLSGRGSSAVIERAPALEDTPESRRRLQEMAQATGMPMDELLARADPPDPAEVLSAAGWATEEVTVAALERRYGRTLGLDGTPAGESRGGFVVGSR